MLLDNEWRGRLREVLLLDACVGLLLPLPLEGATDLVSIFSCADKVNNLLNFCKLDLVRAWLAAGSLTGICSEVGCMEDFRDRF